MNVAIGLWDEVDLLSISGPGQLLARAGAGGAFFVYTVAEARRPITSEDFLTILPEYTIHDAPRPDVLVVPGGGAFYVVHRKPLLRWLREAAQAARVVLAVSDGIRILRAAGVPEVADPALRDPADDAAEGVSDALPILRIVEQGTLIAAVSADAAVEAALRVVARLGGERLAGDAARCLRC